MNGARILVVEDDSANAHGLEYQLKSEGFQVYCAETGTKALDVLKAKDPHLVLLDIRLPDLSGFDLCRKLREEGWTAPVLILTALDGEADRVLGLELGADDYVVKPYRLREVVARVRALLRRSYGELSSPSEGRQAVFGDVRVDFERLQVFRREKSVALTPIEFRLLQRFVSHPGRTFTREDLIRAVYGNEDYTCDTRTIDVHVLHLRRKIEDDARNPRWLVTVYGFGYKFER